jgi:Tol biopolymer transport system component
LAKGKERRLTGYDFYEMSWPYYMPDGKRFIFSAEGPVNSTSRGPKDLMEYRDKYHENFIFIMDGSVNDLKPAFTYGNNSNRPCAMSDGSIIFLSETGGKENSKATQDLFIYKNGQIKRLTQLDSWIGLATASSDGQCIIFSKRTDKNKHDYSRWLMKIDGTMLQEIKMPMNLLKQ